MAEIDWAIICDYAFLDASRKMCLIGIFDRINVQQVPAAHHQAAVALRMVGDPKEQVHIKVEIVRPTGSVLAKIEGDGTLADNGGAELQLNLAGLPLPDYGLYSFNIYVGEQLSKTIGFTVAKPQSNQPH